MSEIINLIEINANLKCEDTIECTLSSIKNEIKCEIVQSHSEFEKYKEEYVVTPKAYKTQTLNTKDKIMTGDVVILNVPFFKVSNDNGETIYIASEV